MHKPMPTNLRAKIPPHRCERLISAEMCFFFLAVTGYHEHEHVQYATLQPFKTHNSQPVVRFYLTHAQCAYSCQNI